MARKVRLLQRLSMETERFWEQEDPDPHSWSKNNVSTATRTTAAAAGSVQQAICIKKINLDFSLVNLNKTPNDFTNFIIKSTLYCVWKDALYE